MARSYNRSRRYKRRSYSHSRKRKSPSRGWAKAAPKRGRERNLMKKQCGSKCFLQPKNLKFPVCKSSRGRFGKTSNKASCKPDCRGLLSAYRRAQQWKYPAVSRRALSRARKARCSWRKSR